MTDVAGFIKGHASSLGWGGKGGFALRADGYQNIKMRDIPELAYQSLEIFSRNANRVMNG